MSAAVIFSHENGGGGMEPRAGPDAECVPIRAKDIMTCDVTTVGPLMSVHAVAEIMSERKISAVPVIAAGRLAGMITEGDLIRRVELGAEHRGGPQVADADLLKSTAPLAKDVMSAGVVTATEETTLAAIAELMENRNVRRVPILRGDRLVGIVSRSDIVRALAARPEGHDCPHCEDEDIIRYRVVETLMEIRGASAWLTTVEVNAGVVCLRGTVEDEAALEPSRKAVEATPCVREVKDFRILLQPYWG